MKKFYVSILTDHTASMSSFRTLARRDLQNQIDQLKSIESEDLEIFVNQRRMEGSWSTQTDWVAASSIDTSSDHYSCRAGYTDLYAQSLIVLNHAFKRYLQDPTAEHLVMLFTDGSDNSSSTSDQVELKKLIDQLVKTDKFTITARVPTGTARRISEKCGISEDNILEWTTTIAGFEAATQQATTSIRSHVQTYASTGVTQKSSFYKTDAASLTATDLKVLTDISSDVCIFPVTKAETIRPFVEARLGRSMVRGAAYYELKKKETVQPQKQLIIRDKKTKMIYGGDQARMLLGLPSGSSIKVAPGDHGNFDIYVQSTSVNRKLDAGAELVYWEGKKTGVTQVTPVQAQSAAQPAPSKAMQIGPTPATPVVSVASWAADRLQVPAGNATSRPTVKTRWPDAKKPARNRDTKKERARVWLNTKAPKQVSARNLKNYTSLKGTLGYTHVDLSNLKERFCEEFKVHISMADFLKAATVGDIVQFVEN